MRPLTFALALLTAVSAAAWDLPPDRGTLGRAAINEILAGDDYPVTTGYRQVGDRTAFYAEWDASCQVSGFAFSPRVWHLPASRVLIVDVVNRPEVDAILATLRGPGT